MSCNKKILVFADWYEPGYKAGGPIRSCVNFAAHMRSDYEVYVFTSDRDLGSEGPYEGIVRDEWTSRGQGVSVYYCSPERLSWRTIRGQIRELAPEFIYLNSMFSVKFTIFPLLMSRFGGVPSVLVLSPRGMLRSSAVQFKPIKKKVFLRGMRLAGLHRKLRFLASDETEVKDVHRYFGENAQATMIPNFPSSVPDELPVMAKSSGQLSMVFVGRVHPIKGLDLLLKVLGGVSASASVTLTIVGSLEDTAFWSKCEDTIASLPAHVKVQYAGEVPHDKLSAELAKHHIFVLPTKGENFGHAIFEALSQGKPALISDQTPWRELTEKKAGWDLPREREELWREVIEQAAAWNGEEYTRWSEGTTTFIRNYLDNLHLKEEYRKLFT